MNPLLIKLAGLLLIMALSGCASTTLVSSQKTDGMAAKQYRSLLVVGLSETPATRQVFEEIFADELRKRGVKAITSYTVPGLQGKSSRAAIAEALKTTGADGLLNTRIVDVRTKKDSKSAFVLTGRGVAFFDYYDYYDNYWEELGSYANFDAKPVNEIISSVTTLETALFDAKTGTVIWKGISDEMHAERLISSTRDLAAIVMDALTKEGLIKAK